MASQSFPHEVGSPRTSFRKLDGKLRGNPIGAVSSFPARSQRPSMSQMPRPDFKWRNYRPSSCVTPTEWLQPIAWVEWSGIWRHWVFRGDSSAFWAFICELRLTDDEWCRGKKNHVTLVISREQPPLWNRVGRPMFWYCRWRKPCKSHVMWRKFTVHHFLTCAADSTLPTIFQITSFRTIRWWRAVSAIFWDALLHHFFIQIKWKQCLLWNCRFVWFPFFNFLWQMPIVSMNSHSASLWISFPWDDPQFHRRSDVDTHNGGGCTLLMTAVKVGSVLIRRCLCWTPWFQRKSDAFQIAFLFKSIMEFPANTESSTLALNYKCSTKLSDHILTQKSWEITREKTKSKLGTSLLLQVKKKLISTTRTSSQPLGRYSIINHKWSCSKNHYIHIHKTWKIEWIAPNPLIWDYGSRRCPAWCAASKTISK
jgi:hypothetical protein